MAPGDIYLTTMVLGAAGKLGPSDNILIADPSVCPRGKARFSPEIALFILWGQSLIALIPLLRQSIVLLLPARGKSGKEDYQLNLPHALPPRETGWQNWIT